MDILRKCGKIIAYVLGVLLFIVLSYLLYVFFSYHRLPDHLEIEVTQARDASQVIDAPVSVGNMYTIATYNVGFGAYTPDYSFFMDGGTESWAFSKIAVETNITGAGNLVGAMEPDFVLMQEIDLDGTRSYHVNQLELLQDLLPGYQVAFAQNYDSSFLMYPLLQPHGANLAGIGTFSKYKIVASERRSFPISTGVSKLVDLDRCFSVSRIPAGDDKELVLINLHMSAYGNSDAVRAGQTGLLAEVLEEEYAAGNYVIVGGDFNHDLKNMTDEPGDVQWAYPYDRDLLPEHFAFALDLLGETDREALWDSCRDAGQVYSASNYTVTLDGFIISDNIHMISYENYCTGYMYSDHEPVSMSFILE